MTLAAALTSFAALAGCATQTEIIVARSTRLPEEADGMLRVMTEEPIRVGVIGTDGVAERSVAGYVLLHEQDVAQLVRNTEELLRIREDG